MVRSRQIGPVVSDHPCVYRFDARNLHATVDPVRLRLQPRHIAAADYIHERIADAEMFQNPPARIAGLVGEHGQLVAGVSKPAEPLLHPIIEHCMKIGRAHV